MTTDSINLIYDGTLSDELISKLKEKNDFNILSWPSDTLPEADAKVFIYLNDPTIKELWPNIIERKWKLGVLPHPDAPHAVAAFGQKSDMETAFENLIHCEPVAIDVLICNDQPVFSNVIIGDMLFFDLKAGLEQSTRWEHIKHYIKRLKQIVLKPYCIKTAKEKVHTPSLLGLMIGQGQNHSAAPRFRDLAEGKDRRLTLLAVAPRSIVDFGLLMLRFWNRSKWKSNNMPESLGLIRTSALTIDLPLGENFRIDHVTFNTASVECHIVDQCLQLLHPEAEVATSGNGENIKDEYKMERIPSGETAKELIGKTLPFFNHASEEEFKLLFSQLRGNANLSSSFLVLMSLSVVLAMLGLYANSAPVIIGAMILAPLMSPIVSLSMGLARADNRLILTSLKTLAIGLGVAIFGAMILTWFIPLETVTGEMKARLSPTLLDLGVAVISGIAGAYAHARSEVAKSLAGVSIAVALVPPLSVVGIGLGWFDFPMAAGAMLLFLTNLVGIALASSFTFMILGFSPFGLAKRGLGWNFVVLVVISIPLMISFIHLVEKESLLARIPRGNMEVSNTSIQVTPLGVNTHSAETVIEYRIVSANAPNLDIIETLKQKAIGALNQPVILEVQWVIRK